MSYICMILHFFRDASRLLTHFVILTRKREKNYSVNVEFSNRKVATNLLPISQIIKQARIMGANFGFGDPKTHLAYLTKLHLLPQASRKKIGQDIVGCYPEYVVDLLMKIEGLRAQGLTYPQIKFKLENPVGNQPYVVAFLIVGLILGYLLGMQRGSTINSIGSETALTVPAQITIVSDRAGGSFQNLYRLGKVDLSGLLKN